MLPPLNAALSALQAFGQKMGITASNIANVAADGYRKSQAVFEEGRHGEVEVREQHSDTQGLPLDLSAVDPSSVLERSNVALEKEIPELITAVYGFRANLKTVQAQDDILGRLLDTIA